jgi:hypothetical protein
MRATKLLLATAFLSFVALGQAEESPKKKLPLIFEENFEKGHKRWEVTDRKAGPIERSTATTSLGSIDATVTTSQKSAVPIT